MKAKLLKINPDDEYDVELEINGTKLQVFIGCCPHKINEGKEYEINLSMSFFDNNDDYIELDHKEYRIEKLGQAYEYLFRGKVENNKLCVAPGIQIEDESLEDAEYLNGQYVQIKIDRLDVEFLN